jgi:hypothetical protein
MHKSITLTFAFSCRLARGPLKINNFSPKSRIKTSPLLSEVFDSGTSFVLTVRFPFSCNSLGLMKIKVRVCVEN